MSTTTPTAFTETDKIDAVVLSDGTDGAAESLNLITKRGAYLYWAVGRLDTTAVDNPVVLSPRPRLATANKIYWPVSSETRLGNTATADGNTTIDQDVAQDTSLIFVAATTNFAINDVVYIGASDGSRADFGKIVAIDAGVSLLLEESVGNAHTAAQADIVTNKADVFPRIWLPGGSNHELIASYEASSAGPDLYVRCIVQIYAGETTV